MQNEQASQNIIVLISAKGEKYKEHFLESQESTALIFKKHLEDIHKVQWNLKTIPEKMLDSI